MEKSLYAGASYHHIIIGQTYLISRGAKASIDITVFTLGIPNPAVTAAHNPKPMTRCICWIERVTESSVELREKVKYGRWVAIAQETVESIEQAEATEC